MAHFGSLRKPMYTLNFPRKFNVYATEIWMLRYHTTRYVDSSLVLNQSMPKVTTVWYVVIDSFWTIHTLTKGLINWCSPVGIVVSKMFTGQGTYSRFVSMNEKCSWCFKSPWRNYRGSLETSFMRGFTRCNVARIPTAIWEQGGSRRAPVTLRTKTALLLIATKVQQARWSPSPNEDWSNLTHRGAERMQGSVCTRREILSFHQ